MKIAAFAAAVCVTAASLAPLPALAAPHDWHSKKVCKMVRQGHHAKRVCKMVRVRR
jgi:hypothetical protein